MSMANRNDPDVRQHETLPGLCPAPGRALSLPGGARPVEQMVDAAIERIAIERGAIERGAIERGAIERVPHEQQLAHYDYDLERGQPPSSQATRLRWKGLDVSEEFRDYAERIARGEDLPPFEGRVLAEPNAAFPWGSLSRNETPALASAGSAERPGRGGQLALWTSAAVVMALLGWSVALKVQAIDPPGALMDVAAKATDAPAVESVAAELQAAPSSEPAAPGSAVARASGVAEASVPPAIEQAPIAQAEVAATAVAAPVPAAVLAPSGPSATSEVAPAATPSPAVAAGVAVSIAPTIAEPLATAPAPVLAAPLAAPTPAAPTPAAAPAPKPTASPRRDSEIDFGIDELPLPSGSGSSTKGQVSEAGNIGDLARVGQSGGSAARKEPGSESSAKGSLLVDKPSF